jgi:hypothetical protein
MDDIVTGINEQHQNVGNEQDNNPTIESHNNNEQSSNSNNVNNEYMLNIEEDHEFDMENQELEINQNENNIEILMDGNIDDQEVPTNDSYEEEKYGYELDIIEHD